MFKCPECEKQYTKQTLLNRHFQNHQKSKGYSCPTCHVSFFRRDLLSRHVKIHQPTPSSSASVSSSLATNQFQSAKLGSHGPQGRQRCHTACNSCRDSRTKCDGLQPCNSCLRSKGTCEYSRIVRRVSQAPRRNVSLNLGHSPDRESSASEPDETIQESDMQSSTQVDNSQTHDMDEAIYEADPSVGFSSPASLQTPILSNDQVGLLNGTTNLNLPQLDFMSNDACVGMMDNLRNNEILDTTGWPSLHENMFLQPDYFQTMWPGLNESSLQSSAIWSGIETIQDENARALMLMSNDQQSLLSLGDRVATITSPGFVDGSATWSLQGQTVQQTHRFRSGTNKEDSSSSMASNQSKVIDDIINQAIQIDWVSYDKGKRSSYWQTFSAVICGAFSLHNEQTSGSSHYLQSFLDLYFQQFHTSWPLFNYQNFDANDLHPILYLTLVSAGAMFGGIQAAQIGTLLHKRLRGILTAGLNFGEFDDELVWLCQARLVTQVAAMYFGTFSYAQRLGEVSVAQARRMNLFTPPRGSDSLSGLQGSSSERLARWLVLEERRRLAFGILKAETYTSLLLNTRPLVSPEEIDLELPFADSLWRGPKLLPEIFLAIVEQERSLKPRLRFSDLIRIALDRNEASVLLETSGHELLLFGLQQSVWHFGHDPSVFIRLTSNEEASIQSNYDGLEGTDALQNSNHAIFSKAKTPPAQQTEDHLGAPQRVMADLQGDFDRLMSALQKWKQSLKLVRNTVHLHQDRSSVLSSLLLYHLSYIRIQTPLEDMHYISCRIVDNRFVEKSILGDVRRWANSRRAIAAVQHACIIWQLINRELQRPEATRAHFNFLAFLSLHHVAVVLWTFMGACEDFAQSQQRNMVIEPLENAKPILVVNKKNSQAIIASFWKIFDRTSPGRWLSYGAAALRLSTCRFPPV